MTAPRSTQHSKPALRFETFEPRVVFSVDPLGGFRLDYLIEQQAPGELELALADAHQLTGLTQVRDNFGLRGTGQTVVVIDTGIAWDHPALGGGLGPNYRVVGGWDFAENDANPYDDGPWGSHGTHVAGIIGSDHPTAMGVAPGVDLIALRVFDDNGAGYFSWVEQALEWVYQNRNAYENPITAVNLSIGTTWNANTVPGWAMLEDEFAKLQSAGIFISVAAGNSFTTYNTPGLSYPAASSYVVPVASVDDNGQMSYFSQRNSRVIAAPGRTVLSTVPDYVGNFNGQTDDFARYSGTSMAAPYVAGASVLLREAYVFAGVDQVTQQTLYDLMYTTADTVYDPITGQSYRRLNLERAINAVMPADDFASTAATAHHMGVLTSEMFLGGLIGRTNDWDYFSFTAGATGTVTLSADLSHYLEARWDVVGAAATPLGTGGLEFDVTAGQTYRIGLGTTAGVGFYQIDVSLTPATQRDWGRIEAVDLTGQRISAANNQFQFAASRDGLLTVEAFFSTARGQIGLSLYDANGNLRASANGNGGAARLDLTAQAGERFELRVTGTNDNVRLRATNLVQQQGSAVRVYGTAGDDAFTFSAGGSLQVSVRGVQYQFSRASVGRVDFFGSGGGDTAVLTGSTGSDTLLLRPTSAQFSGAGFEVFVHQVSRITAHGGGGRDVARIYDSAGDDFLHADGNMARLTGLGGRFDIAAHGFRDVKVYASSGLDVARLDDSAGNDLFISTPTFSRMIGPDFENLVIGFDQVKGYSRSGADTARLHDSAGNDYFVGAPDFSRMFGPGYDNLAAGFGQVLGFATTGYDVARLHDSAGSDVFVARPGVGTMTGTGYYLAASGFDAIKGYATSGWDVAYLYDSAGNDILVGTPEFSRLAGSGFDNLAVGFKQVYAYADRGFDEARLYDSSPRDTFSSSPGYARMAGSTFDIRAYGFNRVQGYSRTAAQTLVARSATTGIDVHQNLVAMATSQMATAQSRSTLVGSLGAMSGTSIAPPLLVTTGSPVAATYGLSDSPLAGSLGGDRVGQGAATSTDMPAAADRRAAAALVDSETAAASRAAAFATAGADWRYAFDLTWASTLRPVAGTRIDADGETDAEAEAAAAQTAAVDRLYGDWG